MADMYKFTEHCLTVEGEKDDLIKLVELLRDAEGTIGDLRYQIERAFNIDGVMNDDLMNEVEVYNQIEYEGLMNMTKTRFDILNSFQFKCFDGEYSYFGDDHICFRFKGVLREFADLVDDERYSSTAKRFFEMDFRQPYNQPTPEIIEGSKMFFFTDGCEPVQCVNAYFIRLIWKVIGAKTKFFISPMRLEPVYATNGGAWDVFFMPMRYTKEVWMKYIEDLSERMMK